MSEKISKRILFGELVVIVLPSSILLLIATVYEISFVINYFLWSDIAITLCALVAWAAIVSGMILTRSFLTQGILALQNQKPILWILSSIGLILPTAAWVSSALPPPPEYSQEEMFRDNLEMFILGFPMFIPYVHLILEKLLRNSAHPH